MPCFYDAIMTSVEQVVQIPFFQGFPALALREVAAHSSLLIFEAGATIVSQHDVAENLFFLISGSVQIYIRFQGIDDLLVGSAQKPGSLIGWSVFRQPYRYTAAVRCEEDCEVLRLPRDVVMNLVETQPRLGYILLKRVAAALANRLEQTRDILVRLPTCGETVSAGA